MKKCPTCHRTFDDSLRFCQTDGTPLVADEPVDPYKTMVARPEDIAAAIPPASEEKPKEDEEVLQLPDDERKTMYISEDEIRKEMAAADEQVIEIPPLTDTPAPPEPPKFNEPSLSPPSFGDVAPPPSPFSASEPEPQSDSPFGKTTPPIPSPFGEQKPASFDAPAPTIPEFREPEPAREEPAFNPFNAPAEKSEPLAQAEWTPPPAPEASWQNQEIGQNTPFNPPPPGAGAKLNQTLPIVSLIFGVLSICCYVSPLTGLVALVTGYLGMKNVKNDPSQYGGRSLALVGMILGGLFFAIGIAYYVFLLFFGGLGLMMDTMN